MPLEVAKPAKQSKPMAQAFRCKKVSTKCRSLPHRRFLVGRSSPFTVRHATRSTARCVSGATRDVCLVGESPPTCSVPALYGWSLVLLGPLLHQGEPDVPRPGVVWMRRSMVTRNHPVHANEFSPPPPHPLPDYSEPWSLDVGVDAKQNS